MLRVWVFSTESMTLATSPSLTGLPPRVVMMTLANWAASASCVFAWMVSCWALFWIVPTGVLALVAVMASCNSSSPMPRAASAVGSIWMRTAYFWLPQISTWATPSTVESAGEITCWAKASSCESGTTSLFSAIRTIGASAGFTLR